MKNLKEIYLKVSKEYNKTKLAIDKTFYHHPNQSELEELQLLFEYINEGCKVLDIGTGSGIASLLANSYGAKVITLDNIELSGKSALENISNKGIKTINADIMSGQLPFEDNSIDIIIFRDVIEHLLHSPKIVLEEFYRILKPGGKCFATTPNAVRLSVRIKVLLGYSNWSNINLFWDSKYNGHHHHEYIASEFNWVFEKTNFRIIKFLMKENRINQYVFSSLGDLKTKRKKRDSKTNFLSFFIQKIALLMCLVFPSLRSSMILISQKD